MRHRSTRNLTAVFQRSTKCILLSACISVDLRLIDYATTGHFRSTFCCSIALLSRAAPGGFSSLEFPVSEPKNTVSGLYPLEQRVKDRSVELAVAAMKPIE